MEPKHPGPGSCIHMYMSSIINFNDCLLCRLIIVMILITYNDLCDIRIGRLSISQAHHLPLYFGDMHSLQSFGSSDSTLILLVISAPDEVIFAIVLRANLPLAGLKARGE